MATSPTTGALPTMIGTDPTAQKEYFDALNDALKSLEGRQATNWFNVAGAFLNPGRTGSFGEALGNASTVMGKQQEEQEARALPIAQMRAQIAGQKFEMNKQAKALNMAADILKTDPNTASQMISSGNMPAGFLNKFTPEAMFAISQLDPKMGAAIKDAAGMQNETIKNLLTLRSQGVDVSKQLAQYGPAFADVLAGQGVVTPSSQQKQVAQPVQGISSNPLLQIFAGGESGIQNVPNAAGASSAFGPYQITEGTFNSIKKDIPELKNASWDDFQKDVAGIQTPIAEALLAKNQNLLNSAKVSPSALNQYSVWFSGDTKLASADPKTPIEKVMSEDQIKANKLQGKTVGDVMNQLQGNLVRGLQTAPQISAQPKVEKPRPNESLASFQERQLTQAKADIEANKASTMEREKERDAEFKPQRTAIIGFSPEVTDRVKRNSLELAKIAKTNPEVFGVLKQEPGFLSALGTLAQEGVSVGGMFHVGIPVDKTYIATLPPASQDAYIRARQILAENFFANSMANKAAMPGPISNFEEKLLQAPNASLEDTAKSIIDYAKRNLVMNEHRRELNKEFKVWENKNPGFPLRSFFMHEDSPYNTVNSKYADLASQLTGGAQ